MSQKLLDVSFVYFSSFTSHDFHTGRKIVKRNRSERLAHSERLGQRFCGHVGTSHLPVPCGSTPSAPTSAASPPHPRCPVRPTCCSDRSQTRAKSSRASRSTSSSSPCYFSSSSTRTLRGRRGSSPDTTTGGSRKGGAPTRWAPRSSTSACGCTPCSAS